MGYMDILLTKANRVCIWLQPLFACLWFYLQMNYTAQDESKWGSKFSQIGWISKNGHFTLQSSFSLSFSLFFYYSSPLYSSVELSKDLSETIPLCLFFFLLQQVDGRILRSLTSKWSRFVSYLPKIITRSGSYNYIVPQCHGRFNDHRLAQQLVVYSTVIQEVVSSKWKNTKKGANYHQYCCVLSACMEANHSEAWRFAFLTDRCPALTLFLERRETLDLDSNTDSASHI